MRFLRKLHKWLGLIVGLQFVLWSISGLMFAWLDHHDVSGGHGAHKPEAAELSRTTVLAEPTTWLADGQPNEVLEIRLTPVLDRWVWRVESTAGVVLRDAVSGEIVELDEPAIRELAQRYYAGSGALTSVALHPSATIETRGAGATWETRFDDDRGTTLYFSADDGRLVQTRNDTWRVFDFFWMLHTMDYRGRDNFNNPLVITIGFAALWLALSGFLLLFKSFRRQDFGLPDASRRA